MNPKVTVSLPTKLWSFEYIDGMKFKCLKSNVQNGMERSLKYQITDVNPTSYGILESRYLTGKGPQRPPLRYQGSSYL